MTKIALIDPVGGHGGMDFYDYGLAKGLSLSECEVFYFTSNKTKQIDFDKVLTVYTFKDLWLKKHVFRAISFIFYYYKTYKFCKKNDIKTIHLQLFNLRIFNVIILRLAKFFNLKTIVTLHDIDALKGNNASSLHNFAYKNCDQIIVHNQFSFNEISLKNISKNKLNIIPHGNYLMFVEPVEKKIENKQFNLLFFGQIKEVKGLDILLKALKEVNKTNKNVVLTIAGKSADVDLDIHKNYIKENNLTNFVKIDSFYIPNEEVANYFQNSDLVILPYKKIYQSGVLLLTMSYGRPVLCTDLEPFKEIIENDKTGYIFEKNNYKELAEIIIKLSTNKEKLEKVVNNAFQLLTTKYDWINIAEQTKIVYGKK